MKQRILWTLTLLIFCCNIAIAQKQKIVIELEAPEHNIDDTITLFAKPVYKNDIEVKAEKYKAIGKNKLWKWSIQSDSAINVTYESFFIYANFLSEPGDSIHIKNVNGGLVFSGYGAKKYELINQVNLIQKKLFKPINPRVVRTDSLGDYLDFRNYLASKLHLEQELLEKYREEISRFAFVFIESQCVNNLRYDLSQKFTGLMNQREKFNLSDEDLVNIFDSTIKPYVPTSYGLDTSCLPYNSSLALWAYNFVDYLRSEGFKRKVGRSSVERCIQEYYYAKARYKGLAREKLLTQLLTFKMLRVSLEPDVMSCVNDYLSAVGYPAYKAYVENYLTKELSLAKGRIAPNFTLAGTQGEKVSLSDLKGKLVVMDFWFTGCKGCVQMAPALRKVEEEFSSNTDVVFLSISIDAKREQWLNSVRLKKYTTGTGLNIYTEGRGLNHPIVKGFNVSAYPTLFIINPKGEFYNPIPDPRKDNGKGMIAAINEAIATQYDGPYVFYDKKELVVKSISLNNGIQEVVEKRVDSSRKKTVKFNVVTDQIGKTFQVSLKSQLVNEPAEFKMPKQLLAISDIEGNFDAFRKLLQANNVIDQNYNWLFGNGHLVLTGDFFDRGEQVTECLWLIYSLEEKAKKEGGYVHFILGNHEIMNLSCITDYTEKKYTEIATKLLKKEYSTLYNNKSELGRWLRTKNIIEKIGDVLFLHAGISSDINSLPLTLAEINNIARPHYDNMRNAGESLEKSVRVLYNTTFSPFWYRAYYKNRAISKDSITGEKIYHQASIGQVDSTLFKFGVNKIITGHTIVAPGDKITTYFNGKVINLDTEHAKGKSEALFIDDNIYYAVGVEGKRRRVSPESQGIAIK